VIVIICYPQGGSTAATKLKRFDEADARWRLCFLAVIQNSGASIRQALVPNYPVLA